MGCELVAVSIFRSEHGGPTRCRHEWRHGTGVNPSAETVVIATLAVQWFFLLPIASSVLAWSSAGEAEAGSGGDQPAEE